MGGSKADEELGKMRHQYEEDRGLLGEDVYADLLNGLAAMNDFMKSRLTQEEAFHSRIQRIVENEETRIAKAKIDFERKQQQKAGVEPVSEVVNLKPGTLTRQEAKAKLLACQFTKHDVARLIQYASFIQVRGWDALPEEQATVLKKNYADASVDPEAIDFTA